MVKEPGAGPGFFAGSSARAMEARSTQNRERHDEAATQGHPFVQRAHVRHSRRAVVLEAAREIS